MTLQIGNFKAPQTTPETTAPEAPSTVEASIEALTALEEKLSEPALTPAEAYRKRLQDAEISMDYASKVFDDLLSKGYHELQVTVKNRVAIMRTRTYEDHIRAVSAIEIAGPRFSATQEELQARYNLAASLVSWNGVTYKTATGDTEKEFSATMAALKKMPAPVYSMLLAELAKFDSKMFLIFSEGAVENF